jgi:hypothetical protein
MANPMTDEEAADFYADPANQGFNPNRVIRRQAQGDSIPVRFPTGLLDQVRTAAADGLTVSEWVRTAVADALAQRDEPGAGPAGIARELERLARKLRRSARPNTAIVWRFCHTSPVGPPYGVIFRGKWR